MKTTANPRYLKALAFAVDRHGAVKQPRKGTDFPYVIHPIRVAEILARFGYTEDVVIAGLLHDVVEDAKVTYKELDTEFGARVRDLVRKASEPDKSLDWDTRKRHTIDSLAAESDQDARGLIAADKLDNIRSLAETLRSLGDKKTWAIFNAPRHRQHWYYRSLAETLLEVEPTNLLFWTLDAETHAIFPDERRATSFFAGKPLGNPQDARAYLADPIKHWRPKHSAYELATAWLSGGGPPAEVDALLRDAFGDYRIVEGLFEKQTELDNLGRPSQTDLLLLLRTGKHSAVVGVEAKARETFGSIVSAAPPNPDRLANLCTQLGLRSKDVQDLRYQLLHRTVATLLEAERYGASEALMLVQSFDAADPPASLADYQAFAARLRLSGANVGEVTSAIERNGIRLRLAWAKSA